MTKPIQISKALLFIFIHNECDIRIELIAEEKYLGFFSIWLDICLDVKSNQVVVIPSYIEHTTSSRFLIS